MPTNFSREPQHSSVGLSRRQLCKMLAGATALAAIPSANVSATLSGPQAANNSIGLQLYTLRDIMRISVPATLKLAAAVGYNELEFAGYFKHKASDIKNMLDGEGLRAPAAHFLLEAFESNLPQLLDDAQTLEHQYLVVPWLSEAQRGVGIAPYQALAEKLNRWGEACQAVGITLAYHNHDFEFEVRDGQTPLDVLITQTDPHLVAIELDLYWTVKAGKNPVDYFKRYPGRFKLWHVKDMADNGDFADVGQGVIDFPAIFAHGKQAGIEHKFVERDHTGDRIATIEQGYQALNALNRA